MSKLNELLKRSRKKNNRFFYQISSIYDLSKPVFIKQLERKRLLSAYNRLSPELKEQVDRRVDHYNKLCKDSSFDFACEKESVYKLSDLKLHSKFNGRRSRSNYCYDTMRYTRCYKKELNSCFAFGDVTWVPIQPSFVKSRPIDGDNSNSILLSLNRIRHINFIKDKKSFADKKDQLIGVSFAKQPHRQEFMRLYFDHPMCRLGSAFHFSDERSKWNIDYVSIIEQLEYKFILCLEGYDVATNLKWVMSSNSIAVMPKPKFETWFMESTLVGGVHYIEIKDDFSDLEEKLTYYTNNPCEALKIIDAAHQHVEQFRNRRLEKIISMKVVDKYFERTNQL